MKALLNYEIIDHGVNDSQYFQGCGTALTEFDHVVTGCGHTCREAFSDAILQMEDCETGELSPQCENADDTGLCTLFDCEFASDEERENCGECGLYFYLSIRFNY